MIVVSNTSPIISIAAIGQLKSTKFRQDQTDSPIAIRQQGLKSLLQTWAIARTKVLTTNLGDRKD